MEMPQNVKDMLGKEVQYTKEDNAPIDVIVQGARWASSYTVDFETNKKYYSFQLNLKPTNGKRAFWSPPLKSEIEMV